MVAKNKTKLVQLKMQMNTKECLANFLFSSFKRLHKSSVKRIVQDHGKRHNY